MACCTARRAASRPSACGRADGLTSDRRPLPACLQPWRRPLPHELEDILGEAPVADGLDMPGTLVHPERAVGDEPGGLLVDLLRELEVLVAAHEQHRHGDGGQDVPGVAYHLRLGLDHDVARE